MPPDFVAGLDGWERRLTRPPLRGLNKSQGPQLDRSKVDCYGMSGSKTSLLSTGFPSCPRMMNMPPPPPKLLGML